jgi:hypothetical protein
MGLFSPKKTIKVSSTVYNMAGDEANRPNFLKSMMFGAIINPNQPYLGESIVQAYLSGPGINQKSLFNYAVRTGYPGLPTYSIRKAIVVDAEVVRPYITIPGTPAGLELTIQTATLSGGDYGVFAQDHMNTNFPDEADTDWVAEYTVDDHTITIMREGGATVTFGAGIYAANGRFVVAEYYLSLPEEVQPLVSGTLVTAVTSGLPSNSGFTLTSTTNTGIVDYDQDQTRVITRVYSNGDPTVVETDYPHIDTAFNTILKVHEKEVFNGGNGVSEQTSSTTTFNRLWEYREVYTSSSTNMVVNDLGGGETETVTTEVTGDFLRTVYDYQVDTQDTLQGVNVGGSKIFIYKIGTGNLVLDALDIAVGAAVTAEFFPFIPLRLNNRSITELDFAAIHEASKKLYKRATKNQKLDGLIKKVEANEDLDEIDYAYVQWAITLNTKDNEAKKYLYEFWKGLIPLHGLGPDYMDDFYGSTESYADAAADLEAWTSAQFNPSNPLYGTLKPTVPSFAQPQVTTLQFKTDDPALQDFDNRVNFTYIDENTFSGLGRVGAKKGDFWLTKGTPFTWNTYTTRHTSDDSYRVTTVNTLSVMSIYWQVSATEHRIIRVFGGIFQNFIYGGKAVMITSDEALDDTGDSGFLIPLHMPSLKAAGLVSATQLASANTYIVFNSYQVFKRYWYQTFLGMLFTIIVVIVAAALIAPAAVGGISGIFGTNAALGASFGLTGTSAIVAGAVANALAAVIISTALTVGSTAIFGAKWGAIIGSLLSFALSFGMAGGFSSLATLFQPSNLLALSSALANGYQGFVQANIAEMSADMFKVGEEYQKEMDRIQDLMGELMGNDLAFNPMSLTDASKGNGSGTGGYLPESLDDFIQRTTLTGSDIVDLTLSMVSDFSDLSLTLPRT